MSGLILSGCDRFIDDKDLLTKKDIFELKQYCINSGADSYKLTNPDWVIFKSPSENAKVTNIVCIYNDEENDKSYVVDAITIKQREQNGN